MYRKAQPVLLSRRLEKRKSKARTRIKLRKRLAFGTNGLRPVGCSIIPLFLLCLFIIISQQFSKKNVVFSHTLLVFSFNTDLSGSVSLFFQASPLLSTSPNIFSPSIFLLLVLALSSSVYLSYSWQDDMLCLRKKLFLI